MIICIDERLFPYDTTMYIWHTILSQVTAFDQPIPVDMDLHRAPQSYIELKNLWTFYFNPDKNRKKSMIGMKTIEFGPRKDNPNLRYIEWTWDDLEPQI